MDAPAAEATLLVLGIVLAVLQIIHTLISIRNDAGDGNEDGSRR